MKAIVEITAGTHLDIRDCVTESSSLTAGQASLKNRNSEVSVSSSIQSNAMQCKKKRQSETERNSEGQY